MKHYRSKLRFEAIQVSWANLLEIRKVIPGLREETTERYHDCCGELGPKFLLLTIPRYFAVTPLCLSYAHHGDWLVRPTDSKHYIVVHPQLFERTYESV